MKKSVYGHYLMGRESEISPSSAKWRDPRAVILCSWFLLSVNIWHYVESLNIFCHEQGHKIQELHFVSLQIFQFTSMTRVDLWFDDTIDWSNISPLLAIRAYRKSRFRLGVKNQILCEDWSVEADILKIDSLMLDSTFETIADSICWCWLSTTRWKLFIEVLSSID
jgi:hypothetical protein